MKPAFRLAAILIPLFLFVSTAQSQSGIITTIAGNGLQGFSGDGNIATLASLAGPEFTALDAIGNIYISDQLNNRIRKITASTGIITTIAGNGINGYSGDNGIATSAELSNPSGLAIDALGNNIYIADYGNNRIRKLDITTGIITTVAGTGTPGFSGDNNLAVNAELNSPTGLAIDNVGNLWICDMINQRIRKINIQSGIISTMVGNGTLGYFGDYGLATLAQLRFPVGIGFDASGSLYIADANSNVIRKVDFSTDIITTVVGTGVGGFSGDNGLAVASQLDTPTSLCFDALGNLIIADQGNQRIRKVNINTGIITTIAGGGPGSYSGDNGIATNAAFYNPAAVAIDLSGNLYVTDVSNNRIRKITYQLPTPTVDAGSNATICQGTSTVLNGAVTGTVSGTIWSADIQGSFIPSPNTLNATFVPWDGFYGVAHVKLTATVVGGSLSQISSNLDINIIQTPTVGSIGGAFNICSGNTVQFNTSGTGGVWQSGNPAIASIDNLGLVTAVSAGTTSITYTVTNSNNCSGSISQNLTVFSSPIVAPISGPSTVCVGATIGLTDITSGGTWTSSNYGIAFVDNQGNVNGIASGDAVISYTVSNSSNCSSIVTYSVHVNNIPSISQITGNTVIVQGSTSQLNNLTNGGIWSVDNNLIATINNSGLISAVSAGSASVVYQFTDLNNCTAKASIPILVIAGVAVAPITGSNSVCQNSNIQLSDATQGGSWSVSDNTIAFIDQSGKLSGINPGVVTITYSVSSGGVTGSVTMLVTVLAGASSGISGNSILCQGAVNTFTSPTPGGVWNIDNLAVATVDNAGKVSGISTGTAIVTYTVTNSNGCSSSASLPVTVNSTPIVASITGANSVCSGSSIQLTDLTTGGTWLSNNPNALLDNTGKLSYFINLNGSATISYSITGSNGCVGSANQIVQLYATPGFSSILGYPVVCIGNSSQLSNLVSGGVWSSSNPFVASVDNTGKITGITAGTSTISYVVTNAGGCSSTATQVATINALPVVSSITGPSTVCMGSTIQLNNATAGGSWSSNNASVATISSTGLVTPHTVGVATIGYQVTNSNGCITTITQNITVNSIPVVPAITGTGNICLGSTLQLSDALSGGVWTILGSPINATISSSGLVTPTALGSVLVQYQVTNVSGCSASVFTNFNISSAPTVAAITGSNSVCTGATVQLSDVTAGGVWSSSNSAVASVNSSGLVTGVASGTTNIFYNFTNASGCVATANFTITVAQLIPSITSFSPSSGTVGSLVTISGVNLNNLTALTIGGVSAIPVSNTGTTIVAMVMPGATTGQVSLSANCGNAAAVNTFTVTPTVNPNIQQGDKLVGTGSVGVTPSQGNSVAVSADGNTAIVGGYTDNSNQGAAWIFTRTDGAWTQQGNKLVGTGNIGTAFQGFTVALSADGNTAMIGGYGDSSFKGAAWIFIRTGSNWIQQGNKLVGTGYVGTSFQGRSVALSADGNTAVSAGFSDNANIGAIWVFTRNGNTWTQQGNKLVGTGNVGISRQGQSVAISADGNTIITGGSSDNTNLGAAWVFKRTGSIWAQQGTKLVGTGNIGSSREGQSVAISADGNTAIIGGHFDNGNQGAVWIFTRAGGVWSQQGNKIVATDNVNSVPPSEGYSVGISADGNTIVFGGRNDNGGIGAAWVYTNNNGTWTERNKLVGTGNVDGSIQGQSVAISEDGGTVMVGGYQDNNGMGASWVFVNQQPPTISSFSPTSATTGGVITITGTNFNGATAVSFGGIPATSFQIISNTTITATVAVGSTGNVIVTTPAGSATLGGFVFSLPTAVITGSTSVCQNGVNPSISFTGADGVAPYTFTYNINGGPNQTVATTSGNTAILSVPTNISGSYTYNLISVTDNSNISNLQSGTVVITVNPLPVVNITASGALNFCSSGSVTLSSSSVSGNVWNSGETTQSITVNQTGNYSVTVTDVNGCSASSSPSSVTVNPLPVVNITASGPLSFCDGGSVTLSSSSLSGNVWSSGETTQSIIVNQTGNYSVTVTDVNGCSASLSPSSVTVNPLPVVNVTASGPLSFCENGTVTLSSSSVSGNIWSTGESTQSITVNQTGNYFVTVTDGNGCSASTSAVAIVVNALPDNTVNTSGPTTFCVGGSVVLTAAAGNSYAWSTGETSQSITVTQSGNFSVTLSNQNGCTNTSSVIPVTVSALPIVSVTASGVLSFCAGGSVVLTSSSATDNVWSTGETTASIVVTQSGNYTVNVTNADGCSTTTSPISVTVIPLPTSVITVTSSNNCTVRLTANTGTGLSYQWLRNGISINGATANLYTARLDGSYTVAVSQNGCSNVSLPQDILITDITPPVVKTKNITVSLNATGTGTITPAQINNGSTDNCIISNISLDQTVFNCANIGANTVRLTVTDGAGNVSSATAIVTVQDITLPVVRTKVITVQLDANGSAFITPSQVDNGSTDNCSIASMSVLPNSFTCANTGNNIVTLTVTDVNGNRATKTTNVIVQDKIPPLVVTQNITVQLNAAGTATITAAQIDNGSSDICGIASISVAPSSFNCSKVGVNTVTLTVKDTKGNISTGTAQVTVEDNIAPVVITKNISVALTSAGSVTITPAQVNNGSSDKCGIATMVLDKSTFHCSDIGSNLVTLTITDVHGNTSSAPATVTVVGEIPTVSITSVPSNNTYTGGVTTNLYLGYGPKSTILKVIAPSTGAPYTYQWSGTGTLSSITTGAPLFTPTAAGSYNFTVIATNKYGCSSTASISICVTDIRVSGLTGYVYVCSGTQSIVMATSAVHAYLLANPLVRLGNCNQAPCGLQVLASPVQVQKSSAITIESPAINNKEEEIKVTVMPNPSNAYFTLKFESRYTEPISLRVIDVSGRVIDSKSKIGANSTLQIGHNYSNGIYYAEIIQGNRRKVKALIKVAR